MENLIAFLDKAGWIGMTIMGGSVIAVFVVIDRLWAYRRFRLRDPEFLHRARQLAEAGDFAGAATLARSESHPVATALAHVFDRIGGRTLRSRHELEKAVEHAAAREVRSLERFLPTLSLVSHVSPLLGLLGTVTGMIKAFQAIQNLGGKVNASVLAGGIWEAMLTTALGLGVAIPALIAHNLLQGKVQSLVADLEEEAGGLFDLLEDRGHITSQPPPGEHQGRLEVAR